MSVDLSDPHLAAARDAIANPSDPTSWFLLQYAPAPGPSSSPLAQTITLLDAGPAPLLPAWQAHLGATTENVLFGYGEIERRGLVLVFMRDTVGGVKRARAIVHSRAIASLFPDYSAIITLSDPSELTEDLITDRLGLTAPTPAPVPKYSVPGADTPDPLAPNVAGAGRALPRPPRTPVTPRTPGSQTPALSPRPSMSPRPPPAMSPTPEPRHGGGVGVGVGTGAAAVGAGGETSAGVRTPEANVQPPPRGASLGLGLGLGRPHAVGAVQPSAVQSRNGQPRQGSLSARDTVANGNGGEKVPSPRRVPVPVSLTDLPTHVPATPATPATPAAPASPLPSPSPSRQPPPEPKPIPVGISSADYFKDDVSRMRKSSLTSRLKNTFHRSTPSVEEAPTTPPSAKSAYAPLPTTGSPAQPTSPTSSGRFKASSLGRVFGKKRPIAHEANGAEHAAVSLPTSPMPDGFGYAAGGGDAGSGDAMYRPPLPPKDVRRSASASASSLPGASVERGEHRARLDSTGAAAHSSAATLGHDGGQTLLPPSPSPLPFGPRSAAVLSPSPSAWQVLHDARQKSVEHEAGIQERFRRDHEKKLARAGSQEDDKPGEDDARSVRLAYDDSDTGEGRARAHAARLGDEEIPSVPPSHAAAGDEGGAARPGPSPSNSTRLAGQSPSPAENHTSVLAEQHAGSQVALPDEESCGQDLAAQEAATPTPATRDIAEQHAEQLLAPETKLEQETGAEESSVDTQMLGLKADREDRTPTTEEGRLREEVEEPTAEEHRERERMEAQEQARLAEEEAARLQQEAARVAAEYEARRVVEEQETLRAEEARAKEAAAEQERLRAEEAATAKREAEEREVQHKAEEEEQKAKAVQQKAEAEQAKKADIRAQLTSGKAAGGVMLRGWVTVQTYKSMTWRRRHFLLLPTEMQLFKTEGDEKPIQTILLGPGASVSERYEESQVKDSFKVLSVGPKGEEVFFLFTDSAEDKETVLYGLRVCLA